VFVVEPADFQMPQKPPPTASALRPPPFAATEIMPFGESHNASPKESRDGRNAAERKEICGYAAVYNEKPPRRMWLRLKLVELWP